MRIRRTRNAEGLCIFVGAALDDAVAKPGKEANAALYGHPITGREILI